MLYIKFLIYIRNMRILLVISFIFVFFCYASSRLLTDCEKVWDIFFVNFVFSLVFMLSKIVVVDESKCEKKGDVLPPPGCSWKVDILFSYSLELININHILQKICLDKKNEILSINVDFPFCTFIVKVTFLMCLLLNFDRDRNDHHLFLASDEPAVLTLWHQNM